MFLCWRQEKGPFENIWNIFFPFRLADRPQSYSFEKSLSNKSSSIRTNASNMRDTSLHVVTHHTWPHGPISVQPFHASSQLHACTNQLPRGRLHGLSCEYVQPIRAMHLFPDTYIFAWYKCIVPIGENYLQVSPRRIGRATDWCTRVIGRTRKKSCARIGP